MDVSIDCLCPIDPRHEHDAIGLRPTLDYRSVTAIRYRIGDLEDQSDQAEVLACLNEGYILYGIESWSLVDESRKPLPVTRANIAARILPDLLAASVIGDAADNLYAKAVMIPLVLLASRSLPPTPMAPSTSAPTDSSRRHPKPSRRSSTSITPTDGIVATSPSLDGVSNSSGSSVSAA